MSCLRNGAQMVEFKKTSSCISGDSMPRCCMVKKDTSIDGSPPCSPTEASVAPPCYTPHDPSVVESRPAQYTSPQHVATQYEEPRSGEYIVRHIDDTHPESGYIVSCGGATLATQVGATTDTRYDHNEPRNGIYTMLRAAEFTDSQLCQVAAEPRLADYSDREIEYETHEIDHTDIRQIDYSDPRHIQYGEPRSGDYAEPRTVRYLERDLSSYREPRAAEYAEPHADDRSAHCTAEYDESRSAEYAEPRPDQYSEPHPAQEEAPKAGVEPTGTEYAELQRMSEGPREHSAADTEAAHDLLSLAAGVPPLPPAAILTVLRPPETVSLPVYTYTLQPTSVFILSEEKNDPNIFTATLQALPVQQVEYTTSAQPQLNTTYITYQEPIVPQQTVEYQQLYTASETQPQTIVATSPVSEVLPLSMPVSVIEATPTSQLSVEMPQMPISVQVPVIEPVPQSQRKSGPAPAAVTSSDSEPEETVRTPTNEKRNKYDCNECGKRYATSSNLSRHKQTHRSLDSQAAKRCEHCGKVYVSMPALAMHVLTHRMQHVCGVCGKQFSRPWLLRGHLRSHTGEKPYDCPSCGKSFADRSNLRAHLQTHSGDKKWECLRCNKTFALKSYLNKHQEAACNQDDQDN